MAEWLFNHLVPVLVAIVVVIYVTAWRTLAPRKSLKDAGVKFGPETQTDYYEQVEKCDPYGDHFWRDAYDAASQPAPLNYGGVPNGLTVADFQAVTKGEFVIPHRDPYPFEKVPTVDADDPIESDDCCAVSYTDLMNRLRTGTIVPADMPPKLPVDFGMLLSMVMAMIDTNERKGDAQTCDRVFTLLRRRYDAVSLNAVPESRFLELWVDLKQLERHRG